MGFPMANDEYYKSTIDAFVERHGLVQSDDLSGVEPFGPDDQIDLLYRFPDGRPAIGFREILPGELYGNTYYHERLEDVWMFEMADWPEGPLSSAIRETGMARARESLGTVTMIVASDPDNGYTVTIDPGQTTERYHSLEEIEAKYPGPIWRVFHPDEE